jgi:hypothetical protein
MRVLSELKNLCVPPGSRDRTIVAGPFKDLQMRLSLQSQTQVYLGLWERETYSWLHRLSQGIRTAIDIGAAQGEYTLFFLKKTTAEKVYAFEPDTGIVQIFSHNLGLNELSGSDRLVMSSNFVGANCDERQVSLDSLLPRITWPCLIKMDVDGFEEEILKGSRLLNSYTGTRWLIETHSKDLEFACVRTLSESGFCTKVIPNAWWRVILPEQRVVEQNRWLAAWKEDTGRQFCSTSERSPRKLELECP